MEYLCVVSGFTSDTIFGLCANEVKGGTSEKRFVEMAGHIFSCGDCSRVYKAYRRIFTPIDEPTELEVRSTIDYIFKGDPEV